MISSLSNRQVMAKTRKTTEIRVSSNCDRAKLVEYPAVGMKQSWAKEKREEEEEGGGQAARFI